MPPGCARARNMVRKPLCIAAARHCELLIATSLPTRLQFGEMRSFCNSSVRKRAVTGPFICAAVSEFLDPPRQFGDAWSRLSGTRSHDEFVCLYLRGPS